MEKEQQKPLHLQNTSKQPTSIRNEVFTSNAVAVYSEAVNFVGRHQGYVLLGTTKVIIKTSKVVSDEFKAMLNSGSQVKTFTLYFIKRLSLTPTEKLLSIGGVGKA